MNRKSAAGADFLAQAVDFDSVYVREFPEACSHPEPQDGSFSCKADLAFQVALVAEELFADLLHAFPSTHRNDFSLHNYSPRKITHLAPRKTLRTVPQYIRSFNTRLRL